MNSLSLVRLAICSTNVNLQAEGHNTLFSLCNTMSDPLKVLLTALSQTCTQSISAINTAPDTQNIPLDTLRTDFLSLLSLIYSNTTKLSIALNPSNPTYSAAQRPVKDLITHSSTLASNASLFLPNVHGRTLTAEVHSIAKSVLTALEDLARAHLSLITVAPAEVDATSGTKGYLPKTAVVHELIAQAKAVHPQGLSRSNLVAVRKRWLEQSETVSDAEAMLEFEPFVFEDEDDKDNEFGDGWDDPELDLGSDPGGLSLEQQKQIATKVRHTLLFSLLSDTGSCCFLLDLACRAPRFGAPQRHLHCASVSHVIPNAVDAECTARRPSGLSPTICSRRRQPS